MNIQLTDNALNHVRKMLQQRGHGIGLRLSTRQYGCSGFGYVVDYVDEIQADDDVIEQQGIKLVVDQASLKLIDGTTVDFVKMNALNQGFEFSNPNVKDECGCGESFRV